MKDLISPWSSVASLRMITHFPQNNTKYIRKQPSELIISEFVLNMDLYKFKPYTVC